jgi:CHAT domain-containing protein
VYKRQQQENPGNVPAVMVPAIAEKLKYVFLSERARAEAVEQMRQPGLIEVLIREQMSKSSYDPDVCRTLFQLMVPLDFKMAARQTERLLLVLDAYTANLPWEMLQADEEPLALKIAMVRQLVAVRFRKTVRSSLKNTACVIGNPATTGFFKHYPVDNRPLPKESDGSLVSLRGATDEALAVTQTLRAAGYEVETLYPYTPDAPAEHTAIQVFNKLFKHPYRILMVAAHGVVGVVGKDGLERSGVVLSDGAMLTAAEVGQMEVVPDLVFLNCCHLGEISQMPYSSYNRLAYGVSRELIEMGVRCVVAAGWAVDDQAAKSFSTEFFQRFVGDRQPFGKAVFEARRRVYTDYPHSNTWGAYQAYGDPSYVLDNNEEEQKQREQWTPVAPQELLMRLEELRINHQHCPAGQQKLLFPTLQEQVSRLLQAVPGEWQDKPDIQYKLGHVYAEWGAEGYEAALEAYRKAIQADTCKGQVPITAFEQLSNLEVRHIAHLSRMLYASLQALDAVKFNDADLLVTLRQNLSQYPRWLQQIDSALQRLENLFALHQPQGDEDKAAPVQAERHGLIGSAWKRKAQVQVDLAEALLLPLPFKNHHKYLLSYLLRDEDELLKGLRSETGWKKIRHSLEQSSKAYRRGENISFSGTFNPYPLLNRLQLEGLLGEVQDKGAQEHYALLAEQAKEVARQRFHESYEFFDAVMVADAEVALYLTRTACTDEDVDMLVTAYREAMKKVPNSARELGSVIEQLRFLARLAARSSADIKINLQRSKVLEKVAGVLQNEKT